VSILPPAVLTTTQLVGGLIASAKSSLDLAKASSNHELKASISDLYDSLLDVKARVLELDEENRALKQRLGQAASVKRDETFGYWFKDGETSPLCPKCYEESGKTIYLPPSEPWSGGIRRDCRVCDSTYWEKPMNLSSGSIRPRVPRY
jgi:hypothetical protein